MFCADVVVLEGASLVLREDDDLASPFRESLEHLFDLLSSSAPEVVLPASESYEHPS